MTVLLTTTIPGGTAEQAAEWHSLNDRLRAAPGFLFHADGPVEGGWQLTEAWESREHSQAYFEATILPRLPAGSPPDGGARVDEVANVVMSSGGGGDISS